LARDDAGIARAQAFAAGLLPDPQLNFTRDFPFAAGPPTVTAFGLGLSYDVGSLVARSAAESAARSEQQKVDLNVLWQEWQTIGQARLLFVKIVYQQRTLDALERSRDLLALLHARAGAALDRGEVAVGSVTPMLTALQDAARRVAEQSRQLAQSREDLNALLGLPPGTVLKLVDSEEAAHIDEATVRGLLSELPQRRADLMALKAGYGAQALLLRAVAGFERHQVRSPLRKLGQKAADGGLVDVRSFLAIDQLKHGARGKPQQRVQVLAALRELARLLGHAPGRILQGGQHRC